MVWDTGDRTLIDKLLEEQQSLSPVARFTQKHDQAQSPLQSQYYRDLIPLSKPKAGEQYRFEVDLDKCSGCKACVAACHSLNGLEEGESWRTVGVLLSGDSAKPFQQTVTTACHHCVDPACSNGCPVLAYEKDAETGIVRHLDDQCIGCQYCVMMCPYEVPRYSERLGIVRKCDMCHTRLAAGEAPACVQSCPSAAITISVVNQGELRTDYENTTENTFLPCSPSPALTIPSTWFKTRQSLPGELNSADEAAIQPGQTHWPLVWMLVLTQAGTGGLAFSTLLAAIGRDPASLQPLNLVSVVFVLCGLAASTLHLGRPSQAWKAFLGLRRSWLSREIVVFGGCGALSTGLAAAQFLDQRSILPIITALAASTGLAGVLTSVMVYHATRRAFWKFPRTAGRFFGTTVLLGAALSQAIAPLPGLTWIVATLGLFKVGLEFEALLRLGSHRAHPLTRTALLLSGPLRPVALYRITTLVLFAIIFPLSLANESAAWSIIAAVGLLSSEIAERVLFFRGSSQLTMPGGVA